MRALVRMPIVLFFLLLTACTIQLVPSYDQSLVDGLGETNKSTLTLFASLEGGSEKTEFARYEPRYAEVIGATEALRQKAASRQIPPLAARLAKLKAVGSLCRVEGDATACVNSSPASLGRVLAVLRRLRDQHRARGLQPDTVDLFRRDYDTAMGQALAVENALKR